MTEIDTSQAGADVSKSGRDPQRLSGKMGIAGIVFLVVAGAAPLTTAAGVMPIGIATGNGLGFPLMYAVAAVLLLLFAVGFVRMAQVVPKTGAFYVYIREALGPAAGAASAFLAVVAYVITPAGVVTIFAVQIGNTVESLGGPLIPWWVYALVTVLLLGFFAYRNVDLTAKLLGVVLVGEVLIALLLSIIVISTGGAEGLTAEPFQPSTIFSGSIGIALTFAMTGFIGVEATAIYRDEVRNPERTIPLGMYISIALVGIFYTILGYTMIVGIGPSEAVAVATDDPGGMFVTSVSLYLGVFGTFFAQAFILGSVFACALAFQNVMSRYVHSMARDGLLDRRLSAVHPKHTSPHRASVVVTIATAAIILLCVVIGLDPMTQIVAWQGALLTVGVMMLMLLTSIAVIVYFRRNPSKYSVWTTVVAPIIATLAFATVVVLYVVEFPFFVGGSFGLAAILLSIFPIAAIIGVLLLQRSRKRQLQES